MIAPIWIFNKYFPLVDFFFSVFPHLKVLPLLCSLPHILVSISFYCLALSIPLKAFSSITSFLTFAQIYSHLNTFVFISLRIVVSHMRKKHIEYLFSWVWVTSFNTTFSVYGYCKFLWLNKFPFYTYITISLFSHLLMDI